MIVQKFTSKDYVMQPRPVFPAPHRSGAESLVVGQTPCAQDFLGFGVAITGASCYLLSQMEPEQRHRLLEEIYSPEGLNLSVARISIGSSDYSLEMYTYDDVPFDRELIHFSVARDEEYIIPMLKEILAIRPDLYIFASPWTPPGWMKTGGNLCGGYMREEFVECYATYILKFLQAYAANGVPVRVVTPQNEPEALQLSRMTACAWHPEFEANFVKILRQKLDAAGMDVGIWMHDDDFLSEATVRWQLANTPGLREAVAGVAFHYYNTYIERTDNVKALYPDLPMHFTEGGPRLYDHYDTDWCKWMLQITGALQCGYQSFTGWNLMLDENGWPNNGPFSCGGLVTRHSVTGQLSYSGQYRAFAHIAKYITPNSKIYPVKSDLPVYNKLHKFPKPQDLPVTGVLIENGDDHPVLVLVNPDRGPVGGTVTEGRRTQVCYKGQWWYIELMPESVATIEF